MPVKKFASQEIAYAADVNTFLMNQVVAVFDNATARNNGYLAAQITPTAGMLSFLRSDNKVYYYDGLDWQSSDQFTIAAGTITSVEIATLAVGTEQLANLGVTSGKIADNAVISSKINGGAVTEAKINDGAVTVNKIGTNAVSAAKFRQSAATSVVGNATGSTADVTDISASSDATVLRRSGSSLGFAKIQNVNVDDAAGIASTKLGPISITAHAGATGSTVSSSYANQLITVNSASAFELGLPASDVTYPIGTTISVMQLGAGKVTLVTNTGSTINTPISSAQSTRAQYSVVTAIKIASNTWLLAGDLST